MISSAAATSRHLAEYGAPKTSARAAGYTFIAGLVWAAGTAFAVTVDGAEMIQAGVLAGIFIFLSVLNLGSLRRALPSTASVALGLHTIAALASWAVAGTPFLGTGRFLCVWPAILVTLTATYAGAATWLRRGIIVGSLAYLSYNAAFIDPASLTDTYYRIQGTSHPNHIGAIASTTVVALVAEVLQRKTWRPLFMVPILLSLVLLWATKSRTSMISCGAGTAFLLFRRVHPLKWMPLAVATLVALTFVGDQLSGSLAGKGRELESASGRSELWDYALTRLLPSNPLLGIGPGQDAEIFMTDFGVANAHNGVLVNLVDVGILGTVPLIILVIVAFRGLARHRRHASYAWACAALIAGCTHSLTESMFFSMGTPAALYFLLACSELTADIDGLKRSPRGRPQVRETFSALRQRPPVVAVQTVDDTAHPTTVSQAPRR